MEVDGAGCLAEARCEAAELEDVGAVAVALAVGMTLAVALVAAVAVAPTVAVAPARAPVPAEPARTAVLAAVGAGHFMLGCRAGNSLLARALKASMMRLTLAAVAALPGVACCCAEGAWVAADGSLLGRL